MVKQRTRQSRQAARGSVSRRTFIQGVIAASATLSATAITSPVSPSTGGPATVEGFAAFTQVQRDVLTAVLNRIVPAEGVMPGAGDVGVAKFIEGVLREAPTLRRPLLGLVSAFQIQGASGALTAGEIDVRLQQVEQEQKATFSVLLQATYTGYYSHPQVLTALGWEHSKQASAETAYFDSKILDEVRWRGPIYLHV